MRRPGRRVVGARKFLIAYNVFLNTADMEIARRSPRRCARSSGGFRFVKGAGFPGARHGPGFNEPDRLRTDADPSRF